METTRNLIIQGSVGLSKSINIDEKLSLIGNLQNKTVIYNWGDINSSTLINFAKWKTQELCQGKDIYSNTTLGISTDNIICVQNHNLTLNLGLTGTYENKTIMIISGNVILQGWMQENSPPLNLFVDKWLIYLPSDPFTRQTFNEQGFPSTIDIVSSWLYLKGNFIINGLMIWWIPWSESEFNHKLHVQGKITTLNTPLEPTEWRISQIEDMFGTTYDKYINLQNVFTRACKLNGINNDGTVCNSGSSISTTPLVILNGNYPSNFTQ